MEWPICSFQIPTKPFARHRASAVNPFNAGTLFSLKGLWQGTLHYNHPDRLKK